MTDLTRVDPGDLITADFMNGIIDELESLEERLKKLEGAPVGAAPVISGVDPKTPIKTGSSIRISGRNFRVPADENNTVLFGNIAKISRFLPGSDDTSLTVVVPDVFGGIPQKINLSVKNANGVSNSWEVSVAGDEEIPRGETVVRDVTGATGKITEGLRLKLLFELDSRTTLPETYDLSAIYSNAEGVAADVWLKATTLEPADVTAWAGHPATIPLTVTVPNDADSVDVALRATARRNPDLTATSSAVHLVIGEEQQPSDDRVVWKLSDLGPFAEIAYVKIDGVDGVEFPAEKTSTLGVELGFKVGGTYRYSARMETEDSGFETGTADPKETTEAALGAQTVAVPVTATASVTRVGQAPWMRVEAAHMKGDTVDFVSFIRFPVKAV